jgi:hypothetical protein
MEKSLFPAHPPSFLCERQTSHAELLHGPDMEKLLVARKAHKRYTSDIRKALAALGAYNCLRVFRYP